MRQFGKNASSIKLFARRKEIKQLTIFGLLLIRLHDESISNQTCNFHFLNHFLCLVQFLTFPNFFFNIKIFLRYFGWIAIQRPSPWREILWLQKRGCESTNLAKFLFWFCTLCGEGPNGWNPSMQKIVAAGHTISINAVSIAIRCLLILRNDGDKELHIDLLLPVIYVVFRFVEIFMVQLHQEVLVVDC